MKNSIPYIYLVDDSDVNLKTITNYIKKRFDCNIRPFKTAEDCLKIVEKREPNIILSDYHLNDFNRTGINGDKLLLKVKRKHPNISTLLYSSDLKIEPQKLLNKNLNFIKRDLEFNVNLFSIVKNNIAHSKAQNEIDRINSFLYISILLWIFGFYLTSIHLEPYAVGTFTIALVLSIIYGHKKQELI